MDMQLTDGNGDSKYTIQHTELELVIDYAKKWAELSNKEPTNLRVMEILSSFEIVIARLYREKAERREQMLNE